MVVCYVKSRDSSILTSRKTQCLYAEGNDIVAVFFADSKNVIKDRLLNFLCGFDSKGLDQEENAKADARANKISSLKQVLAVPECYWLAPPQLSYAERMVCTCMEWWAGMLCTFDKWHNCLICKLHQQTRMRMRLVFTVLFSQDPYTKIILHVLLVFILAVGTALYLFWSLWKHTPPPLQNGKQ